MTQQPPAPKDNLWTDFKRFWSWFWSRQWKVKGPVLGVLALLLLIAIGASAGGDEDGATPASADDDPTATQVEDSDDPDEEEEPTNTPEPTDTPEPTNTPEPTAAPTNTPEPTATPDPEAAFSSFKIIFEALAADAFISELPAAIETDYFWIDSVDRASYNNASNELLFEASVSFESIYTNDPQEWRDDSWELLRDYARLVWIPFAEGFDEGGSSSDWGSWTPSFTLHGNLGRLRMSCPGSLIYAVGQRAATQAEFQQQCSFTP